MCSTLTSGCIFCREYLQWNDIWSCFSVCISPYNFGIIISYYLIGLVWLLFKYLPNSPLRHSELYDIICSSTAIRKPRGFICFDSNRARILVFRKRKAINVRFFQWVSNEIFEENRRSCRLSSTSQVFYFTLKTCPLRNARVGLNWIFLLFRSSRSNENL